MYKKSYLKQGAVAAIAAGLMLGALPGVAMASEMTDVALVKNYSYASETQKSNEDFKFELTFKSADPQGNYTPSAVYDGQNVTTSTKFADIVVDNDVDFTANGTNAVKAEKTFNQVLSGIDFKAPGIYYFGLKEIAGNNKNIVYSTAEYTVKVYVGLKLDDNGVPTKTPEVTDVFVLNAQNEKAENATFDNTAASNEKLTVSKTVSGVLGNTEDVFHYTLTLGEGATGTYDVTLADSSKATVTAGVPFEFTLKSGQSISIANLPVGAKYTVTEETTYFNEDGTAGEDNGYTEHVAVNRGQESDSAEASGTIDEDESADSTLNKVAYRNEKGFPMPTGITMNTLPFVGAGAVAVAGAVTLVISRKRRAGEEF